MKRLSRAVGLLLAGILVFAVGPDEAHARRARGWLGYVYKARRVERKGDCKKALEYYRQALAQRRISRRNKRRVRRFMSTCESKIARRKRPLSIQEVARVINSNFSRYTSCYMAGLVRKQSLKGKFTVKVVVNRFGVVTASEVVQTTMRDAGVESCVCEIIRRLTFRKGKNVGVLYPLVFSNKGAPLWRDKTRQTTRR